MILIIVAPYSFRSFDEIFVTQSSRSGPVSPVMSPSAKPRSSIMSFINGFDVSDTNQQLEKVVEEQEAPDYSAELNIMSFVEDDHSFVENKSQSELQWENYFKDCSNVAPVSEVKIDKLNVICSRKLAFDNYNHVQDGLVQSFCHFKHVQCAPVAEAFIESAFLVDAIASNPTYLLEKAVESHMHAFPLFEENASSSGDSATDRIASSPTNSISSHSDSSLVDTAYEFQDEDVVFPPVRRMTLTEEELKQLVKSPSSMSLNTAALLGTERSLDETREKDSIKDYKVKDEVEHKEKEKKSGWGFISFW